MAVTPEDRGGSTEWKYWPRYRELLVFRSVLFQVFRTAVTVSEFHLPPSESPRPKLCFCTQGGRVLREKNIPSTFSRGFFDFARSSRGSCFPLLSRSICHQNLFGIEYVACCRQYECVTVPFAQSRIQHHELSMASEKCVMFLSLRPPG